MKQILTGSIVVFLFFLTSCSRQKVYLIKHEFVGAINFDTGTYFIYRDSITNVSDSFWVYRYGRGGSYKDNDDIVESMTCEMIDSSGHRLFFTTNGWSSGIHLQFVDRKDEFNRFVVECMSIPFHPSKSSNLGPTQSVNIELLDGYFTGGHLYSNVYVVSGTYRNYPDSTRILTWFTPDAGLIKYRVDSNSTTRIWELVDSHIIRK